jgi:hypothetical protein
LPRKSSNTEATTPLYRRPRADVYTALLLIAFVGLVLGIVALYFEMADYKFEFRRAPAVSAVQHSPAGLAHVFPGHGPSDGSLV